METKSNTQDQTIKTANQATEKAYHAIIKEVKKTLAQLPTEELRTVIEREGKTENSRSFYCPIVYISMAEYFGKTMIAFAKNFKAKPHIGVAMDTALIRIIYKHTSLEVAKVQIEDRLEEYTYQPVKYEDALKHSLTLDNYKRDIVAPIMERV